MSGPSAGSRGPSAPMMLVHASLKASAMFDWTAGEAPWRRAHRRSSRRNAPTASGAAGTIRSNRAPALTATSSGLVIESGPLGCPERDGAKRPRRRCSDRGRAGASPRDDSRWCARPPTGTLAAMESHDQDPTTEPAGAPAGPEPAPTATGRDPRRLYKSRDERMIAGVCGGIAEYFRIDPVIVRVIAVALVFAGGAGLLAYLAAWLLVPDEGSDPSERPGRAATIAGAAALVLAVCVLPLWNGPFGGHWSGPFVGVVFVGLAGLGVWYLASGEAPSAGGARDILRRAGFGLALLAVCVILAFGGAWATAAGGGVVVAGVIVVLGAWLVASAFIGGARWLILPALALALPAGVVSPAAPDGGGGVGQRESPPLSPAEVRGPSRLGVGQLVVNLRDATLPAGDRRVHIDLGVGQAVLVVPRGACVASAATVGAGQVSVFNHGSGGVDVDWQDDRRAAAGRTRIVVDGDVGVGQLAVTYQDADAISHGDFHTDTQPGNGACIGGARG